MFEIKRIINYINFFSLLLLAALLILKFTPLRLISFYVFFGSYVIEFITDKKWTNFKWDNKKTYFAIIILFFCLSLIHYPFEQDTKYYKLLMELRYPLLGFSIVGIFGLNHLFKLKYLIYTLVLTSVTAIIYTLLKVNFHEFIHDTQAFNFTRTDYVNIHTYVNFYINSSILGIWYLLSNQWKETPLNQKVFLLSCIPVFLFILQISEGRSGFLFGLGMTSLLILYELWKYKKIFGFLFLLVIPIVGFIAIDKHQRMDPQGIKNDPRFFLWEASYNVAKEHPICGVGMSTAQVKFDAWRKVYQTKEFEDAWKDTVLIDSDNQYVQTWMEFGIVGIILLIIIYFLPLFLVDKQRRIITLFFILMFVFQSLFIVSITRHFAGIFCIWMLFLLDTQTKKERRI